MPKQVQLRRGTTAQTAVFTGAQGEMTVDTDKKTAVVHDGSTPGGFPLARDADVLKKANNLSDISGAANRATARVNLDVPSFEEMFNFAAGRAPRGGLFSDGSGTKLSGNPGFPFGTGPVTMSALLRYGPPSVSGDCLTTHGAGNNRLKFSLDSAGRINLVFFDSGGTPLVYLLVPDVPLVPGDIYRLTVTLDRAALATLYVHSLSDRDKSGGPVAVSIAAAAAIDIGNGNANNWGYVAAIPGVIYELLAFNRLLSPADVAELNLLGTVSYADQWGSFSPGYTSNFSAGANGFAVTAGLSAVDGNIDGAGSPSTDDTLRLTCDNTTGSHYASAGSAFTLGKRYRVSFDYFIPSGQTASRIRLAAGNLGANYVEGTTNGAWATATGVISEVQGTSISLAMAASGGASFTGVAGELAYVKNIVITQIGCVHALDLENALPAQSLTVRDRSTSANHGTAAATGFNQVRKTEQTNLARLTLGSSRVLAKILSETASLDFGSIPAQSSLDLPITVNGAAVGDSVSLGPPATPTAGVIFWPFVSAVNTVTVRATNITAGAIDPGGQTFRATVCQFV